MADISGKSVQLRQVLLDRIRAGIYPVGYRLASARNAAAEFGVHSNTVSRIYRELADDGILRTVHGSGTFVIAVPTPDHDLGALESLRNGVRALAEQARRLGMSQQDWQQLVRQSSVFDQGEPETGIWLVECSRKDVDELAVGLGRILGRQIHPLLVDEVPGKLGNMADIFITTPFHYDEVTAMVEEGRPVITVHVVPTPETLVQFAQFEVDDRISVVASNEPTLNRMVQMIRSYTRTEPVAAVLLSSSEAVDVIRQAQVLVDSQSIHERVLACGPTGRVCTVRYQIEPTSVAYVREVLRSYW